MWNHQTKSSIISLLIRIQVKEIFRVKWCHPNSSSLGDSMIKMNHEFFKDYGIALLSYFWYARKVTKYHCCALESSGGDSSSDGDECAKLAKIV